jgi:hypothetical protein
MGFDMINIRSVSSKHQQLARTLCLQISFRAIEPTLLTGFCPVKQRFRRFEF